MFIGNEVENQVIEVEKQEVECVAKGPNNFTNRLSMFNETKSRTFLPLVSLVEMRVNSLAAQLDSYRTVFQNIDSFHKGALKKGWVSSLFVVEKFALDHAHEIKHMAYNTYCGYNSSLYPLSNSWVLRGGIYGGYYNSHSTLHMEKQRLSIVQNGGILGAIGSAYLGNFFTALTLNTGVFSYKASGTNVLTLGIASKMGYNFSYNQGKVIFQPSILCSSSFTQIRDHNILLKGQIFNHLCIEPEFKVISNFKKHKIYANVGMNNKLQISFKHTIPTLKPYVKYGLGIEQEFGSHLNLFIQSAFTSLGRNGLSLQIGGRIK